MPTAKLSTLLSAISDVPKSSDRDITGLALDSRQVQAGGLFFACKGRQYDGRSYINQAIEKGAAAVVIEANAGDTSSYLQHQVPIFPVQDLNDKLGRIAATFYGNPAKQLRIIGITGTNGKTSCSYFIASALQQLKITCGVIGTLGSGIYGQPQTASERTTPDAITLQTIFADFNKQGAKAVAMEVSSHSIDQGRVAGIPFEVGVFTNLTRDHLDYHGDMENYGAVKKRLFDNPLLTHAVINADDAFGKTIIRSLYKDKTIYAYSTTPLTDMEVPLVYADNIQTAMAGLSARIHSPWGEGDLQTALIGQFNLSNVLAVLTTLCVLKIPFKDALAALSQLKPVPGRMQMFGGGKHPLVVVDYAHTPDALEKALIALRAHCQGRLYCIFGCGGERDKGKRPIMGNIAEQYADQVLLTDDNPRHEPREEIVADILSGFSRPDKVDVQHERSKAIKYIIQCAKAGDCILIAGKGAETYQCIGDEQIAYSDVDTVLSLPLGQ